MRRFLKILLGGVLFLVLVAAIAWYGFLRPDPPPISQKDRASIYLMPLPASLDLGSGNFTITPSLGYAFEGIATPRVTMALERFYEHLELRFPSQPASRGQVQLTLEIREKAGEYPGPGMKESYELTVGRKGIRLSAPTEFGILHGLQTLLQLKKKEGEHWVIPVLELKDRPRFPWRGLLIDVARHWIPKEAVLRNLDAMAAVKLNVLHLHLTEYQAFRIESLKYPALHELGSGGNYYTQEDMKEIIRYAADRGIRVVPEFDMPGHSTSWFLGYPELASAPGPYRLDTVFGILDPVMDPTREEVYEFLDGFLGEMAALFPDPYVHIGGDEVKPDHWEQNPRIVAFMEEQGLESPHGLQAYFNTRIHRLLADHGKLMMGWDEILEGNLPMKGVAVQSWRSHSSLWEAARAGSKAILSSGYYLDHKMPAAFHYNTDPMEISGAVTIDLDTTNWKSWECTLYAQDTEVPGELYLFGEGEQLRGIMHFMGSARDFREARLENGRLRFDAETSFGTIAFDLLQDGDSLLGEASLSLFTIDVKGRRNGGSDMPEGAPLPAFEKIQPLSPEAAENILGGEACMWSEMVDGQTIDSRIWPRAAAIAEKLWSPRVLTGDVEDMYRRLIHLDTVLGRGELRHLSNSQTLISNLVALPYREPMAILVALLEEDKFFNRMQLYEPRMYTYTPLNRIVDAARPESYAAYRFNRDVERWLQDQDAWVRDKITLQLETWAANHEKLRPIFHEGNVIPEGNTQPVNHTDQIENVEEIRPHSIHLTELSVKALNSMKSGTRYPAREVDSLVGVASKSYGGTLLPVTEGLGKLILREP